MLIKFLSNNDKKSLISLAEFLSISDKPMLWNGKSMDEASARIYDAGVKFSFARADAETAMLADWRKTLVDEAGRQVTTSKLNPKAAWSFVKEENHDPDYGGEDAEEDLIDLLKNVPLKLDASAPEVRAPLVSTVLRKLLQENELGGRYHVKIVLFELVLMAFADGKISAIELHVLKDIQHHCGLDEESFNEILEQAEIVSSITQKTIALIVE